MAITSLAYPILTFLYINGGKFISELDKSLSNFCDLGPTTLITVNMDVKSVNLMEDLL